MTADSMDSIFHSAEKRCLNLLLRHTTWSPVAWLAVAEAEHVKAATRGNHISQADDVVLALVIIENMEETTVEHRFELVTQFNEAKGICHEEARFHAPLGRLRSG